MDLKNKIVLAHMGYFNKECRKTYKENSKDVCKISTTKDYIGIIELDVRKSKDGVLYCYHGTLLQYWFGFIFSQKFSDIKKKYGADSLEEILQVITEDKTIFLDLKSKSIAREDILVALKGKKFKEIILGNTGLASVSFLQRFSDMPAQFVKAMNGNIFCNFYNLKKLKEKNYKYFEVVFPFQINKKLIENVKKNSLEFRCAGLFFPNGKSYWEKINKFGIQHVSSDFV
jgi:glycerophosphoryl diester phosphodiesterase